MPSSSLRLLSTPSEFYDEVLALIASAKQHVFIASLYIGNGETGLVRHHLRCFRTLTC